MASISFKPNSGNITQSLAQTERSNLQRKIPGPIVKLPDHPLAVAFSFLGTAGLPAVARTCKCFHNILTPKEGKRENPGALVLLNSLAQRHTINSMEELYDMVVGLNHYKVEGRDSWTFAEVLQRCNITKIDFQGQNITPVQIKPLIDALMQVHKEKPLDIRYLNLGNGAVTLKTVRLDLIAFLKTCCPKLSHFDLPVWDPKQAEGVIAHFESPEQMNSLLHFDMRYIPSGIEEFHLNYDNFLQNQARLTYFSGVHNVDMWHSPSNYNGIESAQTLNMLKEHCPNVTNLTLGYRDDLEELPNAAIDCVRSNPKIESVELVKLYGGNSLTQFLLKFSEASTNLRSLVLQCSRNDILNDDVINSFIKHAKKIKKLAFEYGSPLTEKSLANLPQLTDLQYLDLSSCKNADASLIMQILRSCKQLKTLLLHDREGVKYLVQGYLDIRQLNMQMRSNGIAGIEFLKKIKKLDPAYLGLLQRCLWIHDGTPNIQDYGQKSLESDPSKLRACKKPLLSLEGGHLLEQMESDLLKQIHIACIIHLMDNLKTTINSSYMYLSAIPNYILNEIEKESGKDLSDIPYVGPDEKNLCSVFCNVLYKHIAILDGQLEQARADCDKGRLKAFRALLNDPEMKSCQLHEIYKLLDKSLQDKLAYAIYDADSKPDEVGYGERKIKEDARCLLNLIDKVILDLK